MAYPDDAATPEVDAEEAIVLVAGGMTLVDVREKQEWDGGHAPDARLLPMSELEHRLPELPESGRFLVVCHSGMRSQRVVDFLVRDGFDAVSVSGGMMAWQAAGGPVVPGDAA